MTKDILELRNEVDRVNIIFKLLDESRNGF
jgi:hypothetical protein